MKLAAIKKIVMNAKRCVIVNDKEGKQWIGDGRRFYAVDEDIRFERETVLTVLDVDKEKRAQIVVFQENSADPRFTIYEKEDEERLTPHAAIMYLDELVLVFMTDQREVFAVEHSAVKPIGFGREYTLRRREANGEELRPAIAVKVDMFTCALLEPMDAKIAKAIQNQAAIIGSGGVMTYGSDEEELVGESEKSE